VFQAPWAKKSRSGCRARPFHPSIMDLAHFKRDGPPRPRRALRGLSGFMSNSPCLHHPLLQLNRDAFDHLAVDLQRHSLGQVLCRAIRDRLPQQPAICFPGRRSVPRPRSLSANKLSKLHPDAQLQGPSPSNGLLQRVGHQVAQALISRQDCGQQVGKSCASPRSPALRSRAVVVCCQATTVLFLPRHIHRQDIDTPMCTG